MLELEPCRERTCDPGCTHIHDAQSRSSMTRLGIEPRTYGLKVRCSNQLSYRVNFNCRMVLRQKRTIRKTANCVSVS